MPNVALVAGDNVGGNYYPKYTTRNPAARWLVAGFLDALDRLVGRTGAREVHEVGCGEGFLSTRLAAHGIAVRGSDLSAAAIARARQRAAGLGASIPFQVADLYGLEPERDGAELVICCEVLEHLPDPERAVDILAGLARPHLIASVPREPLWRLLNVARGKYWRELGNTPGHLQHWSSARFVAMLQSRLEVVEVRKPLPWTMALCRAR
jgi:2-polyprenyl-3-methyl-5-hydroxy-6-metoxy-1,4-benzoquinol methylase